jgi:hypothetical protein
MNGMIQGGWEYVGAAYVVSTVVLGGYALSLFLRLRAASRRSP